MNTSNMRTLTAIAFSLLLGVVVGVLVIPRDSNTTMVTSTDEAMVAGDAMPEVQLVPQLDQPDVLLIMVDDLNDWIEPLGHNEVSTPNLSELASRGMTFTNAMTVAPQCGASRTAFLTGLRPSTTGVYGNPSSRNNNAGDYRIEPVFEDKPTLPRYLKDMGYLNFGAGKIFHSHTRFDDSREYAGYNDPTGWNDFFPSLDRQLPDEIKPADSPNWDFEWGPLVATDDAMIDGMTSSYVVRRMAETETVNQPRFMAIGLYRPHDPFYVPEEYFDMYPIERVELPPYLSNDLDDIAEAHHGNTAFHEQVVAANAWREGIQAYQASVTFADRMVGRILDQLDQSGRRDNTVIVLMSDHGLQFGEKNHWQKETLWERALKIPFIVVAPGVTTPGSRSDVPVSNMDFYPTLMDLLGLPLPGDYIEGDSLVPLLESPDLEWDRAVLSTWGQGNHSVRSKRWRYTRYADGAEELYDHDSDPNEWVNLASDPDMASVKEELAGWFPTVNVPGLTGGGRGGPGDIVSDAAGLPTE